MNSKEHQKKKIKIMKERITEKKKRKVKTGQRTTIYHSLKYQEYSFERKKKKKKMKWFA